ncbi:MAG: hypothetical protein IKA19_02325 [Muribaculaceae bacterium]|nr:hypothetical protein [Muribaculaceae bacterium]MBQ7851865.1 hypothetical protein [Muribaculaceae bacterium]MBR1963523.1 hypothetical protein [Muribaculaceae bacterium]
MRNETNSKINPENEFPQELTINGDLNLTIGNEQKNLTVDGELNITIKEPASGIENIGLIEILNKIWTNINKTERWILILSLVLFVATLINFAIDAKCIDSFLKCITFNRCATLSGIITILPAFVGFTIAGYAIILSLGNKLQGNGERNKKNSSSILDEISADFCFTISYQIIVLLLVLVAKVFNIQSDSWSFMCVISTFASFLLILNIVFHLFASHSFCKK